MLNIIRNENYLLLMKKLSFEKRPEALKRPKKTVKIENLIPDKSVKKCIFPHLITANELGKITLFKKIWR